MSGYFCRKNGFKGAHLSVIIFLIFLCLETKAKLSDNRTNENNSAELKSTPTFKRSDGAALMFADEFKQTLDRYLFGICPQTNKSRWSQMPIGAKLKNTTTMACDIDAEQHDLAGRLAALALRAHTATRTDCVRLGAALANTLGELARTAANRQAFSSAASKEDAKKRKLSKSQKLKIVAKQRTALAVKKKAAALAAAAAAKMTS